MLELSKKESFLKTNEAYADIPVTVWTTHQLIYLNMWVGRPKIAILGLALAAFVSIKGVYEFCIQLGLTTLFTTFFTAIPLLLWFIALPMILYILTYEIDKTRPLSERHLRQVKEFMRARLARR